MKNRILPLLFAVLLFLAAVLPLGAYAAELDPGAEASLTLRYQAEDQGFSDLQIAIFRVAEAFPEGTFELIPPFSDYPVNIHDITQQSQWKTVATTLSAYIVANQVAPDREALTDADGVVSFAELETGLYLVREVVAENEEGVYIFDAFMVYVPTPQPDGAYEYHVEAKPKCTKFIPKTYYTVIKLWQDEGNQDSRPKEVVVDIYKDGVWLDAQTLSPENNWTYTWYVTGEDPGVWSVAERDVPDGYKVVVRQNGAVFSIVNSCGNKPVVPPETGDTFAPLPWIVAMCLSGIMLLILGCYGRRRQ